MRLIQSRNSFSSLTSARVIRLLLVFLAASMLLTSLALAQQSQSTPAPGGQKGSNTTPEAGGPEGDICPIAIPKKGEEAPKKEDTPRPPAKTPGTPDYSIRVSVPVVTLDVGVLSKDGIFIPGLKQENFRVLEDGVPQTISGFNQTKAPITAVLLVEFANNFAYQFQIDSIIASYTFAQTLQKDDWIALLSYDLRTRILTDFTQDKREIQGELSMLRPGMAMSQETNLFDALSDTLDRLETVEGRKYIILVSSGRDSFSKRNLDQVLKRVQASKDIAIYAVGTGQALRNYAEAGGYSRYLCDFTSFNCSIEYAQADNQLRTFAKMTGGRAYFPLFQAQFGEAFADIAQTIRNQYSITYHPTNRAENGAFRKVKVELVNNEGKPLHMRDEKGKDVKYQIVAREGYKAKQQVE